MIDRGVEKDPDYNPTAQDRAALRRLFVAVDLDVHCTMILDTLRAYRARIDEDTEAHLGEILNDRSFLVDRLEELVANIADPDNCPDIELSWLGAELIVMKEHFNRMMFEALSNGRFVEEAQEQGTESRGHKGYVPVGARGLCREQGVA